MKNVIRFFGILSIAALCASPAPAQERPPIADELAKTYGLDSFGQVDAIRYTFNIDLSALKLKISRAWTWEPKTGQVSFEGKDKAGNPIKVTYSRSQLSSQSDVVKNEVDPAFVNDQYWLLFPFHLIWDGGVTVSDQGMQKLPIGKGTGHKVEAKYGSAGGYTPGDTWDLYVGKDGRVQQMEFHHGGAAKPGVVLATWDEQKKAGPLLLSLDHRGTADGKPFRLKFLNVAVKVSGSDAWIEPK